MALRPSKKDKRQLADALRAVQSTLQPDEPAGELLAADSPHLAMLVAADAPFNVAFNDKATRFAQIAIEESVRSLVRLLSNSGLDREQIAEYICDAVNAPLELGTGETGETAEVALTPSSDPSAPASSSSHPRRRRTRPTTATAAKPLHGSPQAQSPPSQVHSPQSPNSPNFAVAGKTGSANKTAGYNSFSTFIGNLVFGSANRHLWAPTLRNGGGTEGETTAVENANRISAANWISALATTATHGWSLYQLIASQMAPAAVCYAGGMVAMAGIQTWRLNLREQERNTLLRQFRIVELIDNGDDISPTYWVWYDTAMRLHFQLIDDPTEPEQDPRSLIGYNAFDPSKEVPLVIYRGSEPVPNPEYTKLQQAALQMIQFNPRITNQYAALCEMLASYDEGLFNSPGTALAARLGAMTLRCLLPLLPAGWLPGVGVDLPSLFQTIPENVDTTALGISAALTMVDASLGNAIPMITGALFRDFVTKPFWDLGQTLKEIGVIGSSDPEAQRLAIDKFLDLGQWSVHHLLSVVTSLGQLGVVFFVFMSRVTLDTTTGKREAWAAVILNLFGTEAMRQLIQFTAFVFAEITDALGWPALAKLITRAGTQDLTLSGLRGMWMGLVALWTEFVGNLSRQHENLSHARFELSRADVTKTIDYKAKLPEMIMHAVLTGGIYALGDWYQSSPTAFVGTRLVSVKPYKDSDATYVPEKKGVSEMYMPTGEKQLALSGNEIHIGVNIPMPRNLPEVNNDFGDWDAGEEFVWAVPATATFNATRNFLQERMHYLSHTLLNLDQNSGIIVRTNAVPVVQTHAESLLPLLQQEKRQLDLMIVDLKGDLVPTRTEIEDKRSRSGWTHHPEWSDYRAIDRAHELLNTTVAISQDIGDQIRKLQPLTDVALLSSELDPPFDLLGELLPNLLTEPQQLRFAHQSPPVQAEKRTDSKEIKTIKITQTPSVDVAITGQYICHSTRVTSLSYVVTYYGSSDNQPMVSARQKFTFIEPVSKLNPEKPKFTCENLREILTKEISKTFGVDLKPAAGTAAALSQQSFWNKLDATHAIAFAQRLRTFLPTDNYYLLASNASKLLLTLLGRSPEVERAPGGHWFYPPLLPEPGTDLLCDAIENIGDYVFSCTSIEMDHRNSSIEATPQIYNCLHLGGSRFRWFAQGERIFAVYPRFADRTRGTSAKNSSDILRDFDPKIILGKPMTYARVKWIVTAVINPDTECFSKPYSYFDSNGEQIILEAMKPYSHSLLFPSFLPQVYLVLEYMSE